MVCVAAAVAVRAATPTFTITNIPPLPGDESSTALGINNHWDVVGFSYVTGPPPHHEKVGTAFLFSGGDLIDLGRYGNLSTRAVAINDSGTVVGYTLPQERAVRWVDGAVEDLGTLGGSRAAALDINSDGDIVGWSNEAADTGRCGFVWSDGAMEPVECTGMALGINDAGWIVGTMTSFTASVGYIHVNGESTFLELDAAYGINDLGYVIGCRDSCSQIGVLVADQFFPLQGGTQAYAINGFAQVVGQDFGGKFQSAVLWHERKAYNLNALVPPGTQWRLQTAWDLNDAGQIVGEGHGTNGELRAFVLTPIDADVNGDATIDQADYAEFRSCWHGPAGGVAHECEGLDFTRDGAVDLVDFRSLQVAFNPRD